jgi:hypothetical protein
MNRNMLMYTPKSKLNLHFFFLENQRNGLDLHYMSSLTRYALHAKNKQLQCETIFKKSVSAAVQTSLFLELLDKSLLRIDGLVTGHVLHLFHNVYKRIAQ